MAADTEICSGKLMSFAVFEFLATTTRTRRLVRATFAKRLKKEPEPLDDEWSASFRPILYRCRGRSRIPSWVVGGGLVRGLIVWRRVGRFLLQLNGSSLQDGVQIVSRQVHLKGPG